MMDSDEVALLQLQREFANCIRSPELSEARVGVSASRLAVYRKLFFNNISSGLGHAFPVISGILPGDIWQQMLQSFWQEHQATEPQYSRLAGEFVSWFKAGGHVIEPYPWLGDMLVWELAELEAMLAPDDSPSAWVTDVITLGMVPVVTHSLQVYAFDYPVNKIGANWLPQDKQATCLACFRTPELAIDFLKLTPASAVLLEMLRTQSGLTGEDLVCDLAARLDLAAADLADFALGFFDELVARGIIVDLLPAKNHQARAAVHT